jgi:hypothetical protein
MYLIQIPDECTFFPVLVINAGFFYAVMASRAVFSPVNNSAFSYARKSGQYMACFDMIFFRHTVLFIIRL